MFFLNILLILVLVPITVIAQGVTCPSFYPPSINTTNSVNGLVFHIRSTFPEINLRSLQLRPNISEPGSFTAAIDNTSSVLLGNLVDSAIYSQEYDTPFGEPENSGPTGHFTQVSQFDESTVYSLGFENRAAASVEVDFILLEIPGNDGTYVLSSTLALIPGYDSGYIICPYVEDCHKELWYRLYFRTTFSTSSIDPAFNECMDVALTVTLAPTIPGDGTCTIGGYTAGAT